MTNLEDRRPQEPQEPHRRPPDFLDAGTFVIVGALVIAIICAFLAQFVISPEISWKEVGVAGAIICAASISIYILLREYMIRRGRRTEQWQDAFARVQRNNKEITERHLSPLTHEYCRAWEQERLDDAQNAVLERVGLSLADFRATWCKYSKGELKAVEGLTEAQKTAIIKAQNVRRMKYDERYLFDDENGGRQKSPSERMSTSTQNLVANIKTAVTTVITSFLSASFLQEVIFDFSAEAVISCVVKLALVAFSGAVGMISGYNFSAQKEVKEMTALADEQERCIKWCEVQKRAGESLGGKLGASNQ